MAVPPLTLNPPTTWIACIRFGQTNLSRIFNNSPHLPFLHNTKNPYKCAGYLYEIPTNVNFCEHYLRFSKVRRAREIPSFAIMKALIKGIAAVIRCNALRLVAQRCNFCMHSFTCAPLYRCDRPFRLDKSAYATFLRQWNGRIPRGGCIQNLDFTQPACVAFIPTFPKNLSGGLAVNMPDILPSFSINPHA